MNYNPNQSKINAETSNSILLHTQNITPVLCHLQATGLYKTNHRTNDSFIYTWTCSKSNIIVAYPGPPTADRPIIQSHIKSLTYPINVDGVVPELDRRQFWYCKEKLFLVNDECYDLNILYWFLRQIDVSATNSTDSHSECKILLPSTSILSLTLDDFSAKIISIIA